MAFDQNQNGCNGEQDTESPEPKVHDRQQYGHDDHAMDTHQPNWPGRMAPAVLDDFNADLVVLTHDQTPVARSKRWDQLIHEAGLALGF